MNISSIYGREPGYYAQGASQNNNTQLQGLERQLQLLSAQKLQAAQGGGSEREGELEAQIEKGEEQIQHLKQERVQPAEQSAGMENTTVASLSPSESRYLDFLG